MKHDRKADVADRLRHALTHADPAPLRSIKAIEPAVILVRQTIGLKGVQRDTMRVMAERHRRVRQKVRLDSLVEGRPIAATVRGFEDAPDGDADVKMPRVARVDEDGVQELTIGRTDVTHFERIGWSLKPATGSQVTPPSCERNSPAGELPAYHVAVSDAWPGVSQKTRCTERASSPSAALRKAGGCDASRQVRPRSTDLNTVGPRWPVSAAMSNTLGSRGSCTM